MAEFTWIQASLFVMLAPQFTAVTGDLSLIVRDGLSAGLPCENVMAGQSRCDGTTWIFSSSRNGSVEVIRLGQIGTNAQDRAARLGVSPNCSLLLKPVQAEDAGRYFCRQYRSDRQQGPDATVHLAVVTVTESEEAAWLKLNCSVSTHGRCLYTAKWLHNGIAVENNVQTSCSASLLLPTDNSIYKSPFVSLKCVVTNGVQEFAFSLRPSDGLNPGMTTTAPVINGASTKLKDLWWLFIIAAVVLATLLIIVGKVISVKRTKAKEARMNDKVGLTSKSDETPSSSETAQAMAVPEDGIFYASISYIKNTKSKGQVQAKNDEAEDDSVTYMAVKASATDLSNI